MVIVSAAPWLLLVTRRAGKWFSRWVIGQMCVGILDCPHLNPDTSRLETRWSSILMWYCKGSFLLYEWLVFLCHVWAQTEHQIWLGKEFFSPKVRVEGNLCCLCMQDSAYRLCMRIWGCIIKYIACLSGGLVGCWHFCLWYLVLLTSENWNALVKLWSSWSIQQCLGRAWEPVVYKFFLFLNFMKFSFSSCSWYKIEPPACPFPVH